MASSRLTIDTTPQVEQLHIERWREMSAGEKSSLVSGLTAAADDLTLAGVRHRHPHASPREHFLRLALITLGRDLPRRAYPEIDELGIV
jgi:hypothetical protein